MRKGITTGTEVSIHMLDFYDNMNVHLHDVNLNTWKIFMAILFFVLVCEEICVMLYSCLLVIYVWRCMLYGVVFRSQVGIVRSSVSFSGVCCME
jgi:membrane protein required for beta-lactamase induction